MTQVDPVGRGLVREGSKLVVPGLPRRTPQECRTLLGSCKAPQDGRKSLGHTIEVRGAHAILLNPSGVNIYNKIEITPYILSDHHRLKLDINNKRNDRKLTNSWKLNNFPLSEK